MTATSTTDRIERRTFIRAPRSRVWRALTNLEEFGKWFSAEGTGTVAPGVPIDLCLTFKGHEGKRLRFTVERVEPETLYSWRWHPNAHDESVDYSHESTTLVEFRLEEADGGTMVTVIETGFDQLPVGRRDQAFRSNSGGWDYQMGALERYASSAD